jgi:hypothetical protein
MIAQSNVLFPDTTWCWLTGDDNAIIDPFDYGIWDTVPAGQGLGHPLFPTDDVYDLNNAEQLAAVGFHIGRVAAAVAALPRNNDLTDDPAQVLTYKNNFAALAWAEMNEAGGPSAAASGAGVHAVSGTLGAGPCVAVLARASKADGGTAVGCIHLSTDDMQTLQHAVDSIGRLRASLSGTLGAPVAASQCYLIGGDLTDPDDQDVIEDYARAIGALQKEAQVAGGLTLVGGLVPAARRDGDYIDAFITQTNVYYARSNRSTAADNDSSSGTEDNSEEST